MPLGNWAIKEIPFLHRKNTKKQTGGIHRRRAAVHLWRIGVLRIIEIFEGLHHAPNEEGHNAHQAECANQDCYDVLGTQENIEKK